MERVMQEATDSIVVAITREDGWVLQGRLESMLEITLLVAWQVPVMTHHRW